MLEVWGGIECTINRVRNDYMSQLSLNGHAHRPDDLDRIAGLGVTKLRYPLLWEFVAPGNGPANWSWADERMARIRKLQMDPIVGLLHHGSGPSDTSLIDPQFPERLATYAASVAERYPWVVNYTPVNEPLTTARFSGLYGIWFPHGTEDRTFARCLVNQCKATVLAMAAIRKVSPGAQLVQTEDLAKVHSTARLAYQADFENERRWASFDLLLGKITEHHPLWRYFTKVCSIPPGELAWFADHPCPPNILGLNYYVTSERFLDHRLSLFPPNLHGGNGRHRYVDIEAVRLRPEGLLGAESLLREAWRRYHLPLAITEAHLGCQREEQLRWLRDIWCACTRLVEDGVDLRAMTIWSLLGAHNWDNLLTSRNGRYESGAFDLRASSPRPTALARAIKALSCTGKFDHPVLDAAGWWHRPERFYIKGDRMLASQAAPSVGNGRRILIFGVESTLGRALERVCALRNLFTQGISREQIPVISRNTFEDILRQTRPWAVINTLDYGDVSAAERCPDDCRMENVVAATLIAGACQRHRIPLVCYSSNLVFGGQRATPYFESDLVNPLNQYGASKVEAEMSVQAAHTSALFIRTGALFCPWTRNHFMARAFSPESAAHILAREDVHFSPSYVPDVVHSTLDLLIDGGAGIWHLCNETEATGISWVGLAQRTIERSAMPKRRVVPVNHITSNGRPVIPNYTVMHSEKARLMPHLDDALARCFSEHTWAK